MKKTIIIVLVVATLFCWGYIFGSLLRDYIFWNTIQERWNINKSDKYLDIFKDTPAWALVNAINQEDIGEIENILKKNPELLNYQDPKDGITPLFWSVGMEKYQSAEALLRLGADPNITTPGKGWITPLFLASGYSWVDGKMSEDPRFVKILLKYNANPNLYFLLDDPRSGDALGLSPLMESIIFDSFEKTKALVEAGADINHKTKSGETAAYYALKKGFRSVDDVSELMPAYYLIVGKKAQVTDPLFTIMEDLPGETPTKLFPIDILRSWETPLGSPEHKIKMEIVQEFERQGVKDYRSRPIRWDILAEIKKLYPDTWEEYIEKY